MALRALALSAAALVALTGCSAASTPPSGPTTPKSSVAEEAPTQAAAAATDLQTASTFVKAIYLDDYDQAGTLAADNSIAARYVAHQVAAGQVDDLNGTSENIDPSDIDVTIDDAAKTVAVEDRSGDSTRNYLWQSFAFDGGKVASWEVKGQGKLESRLWTTKATDKSDGVSAELVSAYQGNSKNLTVVVSLKSSSKDVRIIDSSYTPDDGFKHEDTAAFSADVDKDGKALTYYTFTKATVGGKLKLTVDKIDGGDNSLSDYLTTLELKVK